MLSAAYLSLALLANPGKILVGDPVNGDKLYAADCARCHGAGGEGSAQGPSLLGAGRMNALADEALFAAVKSGRGVKGPHRFDQRSDLDVWDLVERMRQKHLLLADFFPKASRYVVKAYAIDEHGLDRLAKALGKKVEAAPAPVFTFFDFPSEQGRLRLVPQEPVQLDELKKDRKVGYLMFLPLDAPKLGRTEVGLALDAEGKILELKVHEGPQGAAAANKALSRFRGLGKMGQSERFRLAGGADMQKWADAVFPVYLRAMESATMYVRDENERTWADEP